MHRFLPGQTFGELPLNIRLVVQSTRVMRSTRLPDPTLLPSFTLTCQPSNPLPDSMPVFSRCILKTWNSNRSAPTCRNRAIRLRWHTPIPGIVFEAEEAFGKGDVVNAAPRIPMSVDSVPQRLRKRGWTRVASRRFLGPSCSLTVQTSLHRSPIGPPLGNCQRFPLLSSSPASRWRLNRRIVVGV